MTTMQQPPGASGLHKRIDHALITFCIYASYFEFSYVCHSRGCFEQRRQARGKNGGKYSPPGCSISGGDDDDDTLPVVTIDNGEDNDNGEDKMIIIEHGKIFAYNDEAQ
jgi:hypothetical protein